MGRRPLTLVSRSVPQRDRVMSNAPWGGVCVCVCSCLGVCVCVCVHSAARQTGSFKPPMEKGQGRKRERKVTVGEGPKGYSTETPREEERDG